MSRAEDLFTKMCYTRELSNQEILELEQEMIDFFKSDEPEEDKENLRGYTEMFSMVCSAVHEGLLEDRKPSKPIFPKKKCTFELELPDFLKRRMKEK